MTSPTRLTSALVAALGLPLAADPVSPVRPNIVLILADDLGRGMLGCYGQRHFRTPNIDRLATQGVRFENAYSCAFCAPARASLLTGMHDAHAGRWTFNRGGAYGELTNGTRSLENLAELINHTGIRPRDGDTFLATVAKRAGYITGQIGKLEWGFCTTAEDVRQHGWDSHYGYYDHAQCHGFYPMYLFEDGRRIDIPGNTRADFGVGPRGVYPDGRVAHDPEGRAVYSQDLFDARIVQFLRTNRDNPFFLYHPSQLPHGPTYYPDPFPEVASNPDLTPVEREFASMVLRLDRTVGLILDELDRLGIADRTLVLFASDNGHAPHCYAQPGRTTVETDLKGNRFDQLTTKFTSAACGDVFDGNDGMGGIKTQNWEGGTRVPLIAHWPGRIAPGGVSNRLVALYDLPATLADLTGQAPPERTDGLSLLPHLLGQADAPEHGHVVYASSWGPALVTRDGWKLRIHMRRDKALDFNLFGTLLTDLDKAYTYQLYHLPTDRREEHDLAAAHPEIVHRLTGLLLRECDGNFVNATPQAHFAPYNAR